MLLQLALEVKGFTTLITHHSLGLLVHLVEVLAEVGVLLVALGTLQLETIMKLESRLNIQIDSSP